MNILDIFAEYLEWDENLQQEFDNEYRISRTNGKMDHEPAIRQAYSKVKQRTLPDKRALFFKSESD